MLAGEKERCGVLREPHIGETGPGPGQPDPASAQGWMAELEAGSPGAAQRCLKLEEGPRPWPDVAASSLGDRGPLL